MTRMATADLKAMRKHAGAAAAMLRALSHEARLLVLCELTAGECTAGDLVERSGLVETRREAQSIFYRIADPKTARVLSVLHEIYCKR